MIKKHLIPSKKLPYYHVSSLKIANAMNFKMSVVIDIYPFKWEFKCVLLNKD